MTDTDIVIVGGGVVGVSCAAQMSGGGYSVALIERHPKPGWRRARTTAASSMPGSTIPKGSLKAQTCVDGAARLYSFCAAHGVPHDRCGKLVVASHDEEVALVEALAAPRGSERGRGAGDRRTAIHPGAGAARAGIAALWSPRPDALSREALVRALLRVAQSNEAMVLAGTRGHRWRGDGGRVRGSNRARSASQPASWSTRRASTPTRCRGALGGERYTIYPCRGEYAELRKARAGWVNGLVYPVPLPSGHGLGVHLTKTLGRRRAARSHRAVPVPKGRL